MASRLYGWLFLTVLSTACPGLVLGAATPPDESAASSPARPRRVPMDYGSILTYTVGLPSAPGHSNDNLALKGVCLRVGEGGQGAVCFDTDLLRYYAGWTGGFLDLSRTHLTSYKGDWHALIEGNLLFSTRREPGG